MTTVNVFGGFIVSFDSQEKPADIFQKWANEASDGISDIDNTTQVKGIFPVYPPILKHGSVWSLCQ